MEQARENYAMGYGPWVTAIMNNRTAQSHAAFLLPHLKAGQRVLDCGCGPGTITLGLAQAVTPGGTAVGVEVEPSQVQLATRQAAERGIGNASFRAASAYQLPFPDASFDVVYMSAVLGNLREPARALFEARRVLVPGGLLAIREFDHAGDLIHPDDRWLALGRELYDRLRREYGHDPESGRKLRARLREIDVPEIHADASYETVADDAVIAASGAVMAQVVLEAWAGPLIERGWADRDTIERIAQAWRGLGKTPGGLIAAAWCEIIGRKRT